MWLILGDCGGWLAVSLTYFTVVFVYIGFIRIGIWEGLQSGSLIAPFHFIIFQYNCFMIFWSHFKCMTTEPGLLPRGVDTLDYRKLPNQL